jgi:hypothetical protein
MADPTELPPIINTAPPLNPRPGIGGSDSDVSSPVPQTNSNSITGTPGTGGTISIGTYHGYPIPEPHRVWKFDVFLPNLVPKDRMPIVQSIEPSFDNTSVDQHPIGGRHHFAANFFDATELQLLFYDDENQNPIEFIYAWKKLIRNYNDAGIDDGTYRYPGGSGGYFRDIDVYLMNMKNKATYNISYRDCFPTQMAPLRLDYEPSARTVIAQHFAVNRITTLKMITQASAANPVQGPPAGAALNLANVQALRL